MNSGAEEQPASSSSAASPAMETISFAVDGASYEIELAPDEASALRNDLAPYLAAARPTCDPE
ncbi:histone-like nucleoid-structuring protein Lsr2 [Streptomyces sp. NPDC087908]|uniref:Lsr2 dimerization domain-containing protein n=1 Tax=Streptomyces sp. NPDC087908 TaxID=3365820 RepID=UPI0038234950